MKATWRYVVPFCFISVLLAAVTMARTRFAGCGDRLRETLIAQNREAGAERAADRETNQVQALVGAVDAMRQPPLPDLPPHYTFANRIREAFRTEDATALAGMIVFPITVVIENKLLVIATPEEFISNYQRIVTAELRRGVLEQRNEDLFVGWLGTTLGNELILFDYDGRIISFRNTGWTNDAYEGESAFLNPQGRSVVHPLKGEDLRRCLGSEALRRWVGSIVEELPGDFTVSEDMAGKIRVGNFTAWYEFYLADLNNDGHDEYVVTWNSYGSLYFSHIGCVYRLVDGKPVRLPIEEIAARSFHPERSAADFSWYNVQSWLASPFIVKRNGSTYFGFDGGKYYIWRGNRIQRADPMGLFAHPQALPSVTTSPTNF